MMRRLLLILVCAWLPVRLSAQERRWEIEGYAGALAAQPASAGTQTLPPAGSPIVTTTPTFPSRATTSWFFGDGATLLNGVLEEFGRTSRLSPLDAAFTRVAPARTAAFGVRVRRRVAERSSVEIGVDVFAGSPIDAGQLSATVVAARDSFAPAFTDLFASGPFSRTAVTAQGMAESGNYREMALTAVLDRDVFRLGVLQPYVAVGGGVVAAHGTAPSALLLGRYTTSILGEVPIDEADLVAVRVSRSTAFAIVAGGGVRHELSATWCLRVDARALIGPDTTRIRIDANPTVTRGTPAGFIESFTNPAIQFSNDPSTGRLSSLSGGALHDVEVFKGGLIARTVVGITIARRF
jgi:hypothetical protein